MNKIILYGLLGLGAILALFPFYWMFIIATNPNHVVNSVPPALLPGNQLVENFKNVLANIDFFWSAA